MEESQNTQVKKERRGVNSFLVLLLVLLLGGVIAYLASIINSQRFYLLSRDGQLVVERGYFFPVGSGPFKDDQREYQALYAPIAIPAGVTLPEQQSFNNLGDLDRRLFSLLQPWARNCMQSQDNKDFAQAVLYVERARKLSGLSESQQKELNGLRGDLAYREGRHLVSGAVANLQKALKAFRLASDLGTSEAQNVDLWVTELEKRLAEYKLAGQQGTPAELLLFKPVEPTAAPAAPAVAVPTPAPVAPAPVAPVVTEPAAQEQNSSVDTAPASTQLAPVAEPAPTAVQTDSPVPVTAPATASDQAAPAAAETVTAPAPAPASVPAPTPVTAPNEELPRSPGSL